MSAFALAAAVTLGLWAAPARADEHGSQGLDAQYAALEKLSADLERAEADLRAVEAQLEIAEKELDDATERHDRARRRHAGIRRRVERIEDESAERSAILAEQVAESHKMSGSPTYFMMLDAAVRDGNADDVAIALRQLEHVTELESDNLERLTDLHRRLLDLRARAEAARDERNAERAAAQRSRDTTEELHREQEDVVEHIAEQRDELLELVAAVESDPAKRDALLEELRRSAREDFERLARDADADVSCPVPTGSFINDWHYPRTGGRLHEGNDVFADRGDPVHAAQAGVVRTVNEVDRWRPGSGSGLGGKTITVVSDGTTSWYYAHLDEIESEVAVGARIEEGQRIGTVGNTGNARHTPPHLHLGRYVDGRAENPYPFLDRACRGE